MNIERWIGTFNITSDDVDYRSKCRWSSLLSLMQQAADAHVEALGVIREQMLAQDMGWMLITMDARMDVIPQYGETLQVATWSRGAKGALWQRDYRWLNERGDEIGSARSVWALVDIRKRKILRPSAFPYEVPVHAESAGPPPDKKIVPDEAVLEEAYTHTVRYSGIDSNGHLNNARYADLCFDALQPGELEQGDVTGFRITYHHEAKMNDVLHIERSAVEAGTIYFKGNSPEGENYFEAAIVMNL
ncbi:acyl-ACP thioesterase [Paenibacillus campinasensis]|uniref:Acyl-ACP thioesterase n=1 Tax=Paenibacillus campinasensis TaxID=66347 RepID=A0ABW9T209_9BACL|nr:acyl-ACP thioesterase domain-containing protein [Paenibacillus campinasensis]MUG67338.1 acyl-ACP thioesterase [Paenibacillus campinasensis]